MTFAIRCAQNSFHWLDLWYTIVYRFLTDHSIWIRISESIGDARHSIAECLNSIVVLFVNEMLLLQNIVSFYVNVALLSDCGESLEVSAEVEEIFVVFSDNLMVFEMLLYSH